MNKKVAAQFAEDQIKNGISKQDVFEYLINNNDLGHKINKNIVREIATYENILKFKKMNYVLISILIFLFIIFYNKIFNNIINIIELNPEEKLKYLFFLIIYILFGIFYIRSIYQFKFGNHLATFICLPLLCLRTILNIQYQLNVTSLVIDLFLIIIALSASIIGIIIHKNVFDYPKISK